MKQLIKHLWLIKPSGLDVWLHAARRPVTPKDLVPPYALCVTQPGHDPIATFIRANSATPDSSPHVTPFQTKHWAKLILDNY